MSSYMRSVAERCVVEMLENRQLLSADLAATLVKFPESVPAMGTKSVTVSISNAGDARARGAASVSLYASADQTLDAGDTLLASKSYRMDLLATRSTNRTLKFGAPATVPDGSYYIIAKVEGDSAIADANTGNNAVAAATTSTFTQPFIDLTTQVTRVPTQATNIGSRQRSSSFTTAILNSGNVPAKGSISVSFYLSPDQTLDPADPQIYSGMKRISISPGKLQKITVSTKLAATIPNDELYVIAVVNADGTLRERNTTNNAGTSASVITVNNPAVPAGPFMISGVGVDMNKVVIGHPELVQFTVHVSQPSSSTEVRIHEVDANDAITGLITTLYDDGSGAHRDSVAHDGVFNAPSSIAVSDVAGRRFVAVLSDPSVGNEQQTAAVNVTGLNTPSEAQIQAASAVGEAATDAAANALANRRSIATALQAAMTTLQNSDEVVPGSVMKSKSAVQWEGTDGILYAVDAKTLANEQAASGGVKSATAAAMALAASPDDESLGTAISIAPYAWQFEPYDEADDISGLLRANGYGVTEYRNPAEADQNVTIGTFRNLGQYDAVVISSHGALMPDSREVIMTGQRASLANDLTNLFDLLTHRVVNVGGTYGITPSFISTYTGSMADSIVYVSSCHSAQTGTMSRAFLNAGAAAYIGYTESVSSDFAFAKGMDTFTTLLRETNNTVGDIPGINWQHDSASPYAKFVSGNVNAVLPRGSLLSDYDIYVNYNWPQTQRDLDTNTMFMGTSMGWHLSNSSSYMHWTGDDTSAGGSETTTVDAYQAWLNDAWSGSTTVSVGCDWYSPAGGSGPAFITVALKDKTTGELTRVWTRVVDPNQQSSGAYTVVGTVNVTLFGNDTNPRVKITLI